MHISFISSFPPKSCGVGEFCYDLIDGLLAHAQKPAITVYAIDDIIESYPYSSIVSKHLYYKDREAYTSLAQTINISQSDVCVLQHEFNLFGGETNEYILDFTALLQKPLVVIMHNIPIDKTHRLYEERKKHLLILNNKTKLFVTTTAAGKAGLMEIGIPHEKIKIILHGSPLMPSLNNASVFKHKLGLDHVFTVLLFGLMRQKKGIEYIIEAIQKIHKEVPQIKLLLLGKQDPTEQTPYLNEMKEYAHSLGISSFVDFIEAYVAKETLYEYIIASDVIVTPYLRVDQVSSGPLTFGVGAGIPVISTPYLYAKELLKDIGILVPFKDSQALAMELKKLALEKDYYVSVQEKTIAFGKTLSWSKKAEEYLVLFKQLV